MANISKYPHTWMHDKKKTGVVANSRHQPGHDIEQLPSPPPTTHTKLDTVNLQVIFFHNNIILFGAFLIIFSYFSRQVQVNNT